MNYHRHPVDFDRTPAMRAADSAASAAGLPRPYCLNVAEAEAAWAIRALSDDSLRTPAQRTADEAADLLGIPAEWRVAAWLTLLEARLRTVAGQ